MNNNQRDKAIQVLQQGGIIIFPTDTAFGIGCRIDNYNAVDKLFRIRKRPLTQAVPILVPSEAMALTYLNNPSDIVRLLMKDNWPGALTVVTPCKKEKVYAPIRGNGENIGVRMPGHHEILHIIDAVGVPILGSSANFHGDRTPHRLEELDPNLMKLVDFVLSGQCSLGTVSTVVDCSVEPYVVLRQGAVTLKVV